MAPHRTRKGQTQQPDGPAIHEEGQRRENVPPGKAPAKSLADLALKLERRPADAPFEEVLGEACDILRGLASSPETRSGIVLRRQSDVTLLRDIVATLTVRYARYVPTMFGTRLSPRLAEALTRTSGGGKQEADEPPHGGAEADRQAAFLGDVLWMVRFLYALTGRRKTRRKEKPRRILYSWIWQIVRRDEDPLPAPLRANAASDARVLREWTALWLLLALVDLGGCGALLPTFLQYPEFRAHLWPGARRGHDAKQKKRAKSWQPRKLAKDVYVALAKIFPPRTSPAAPAAGWTPPGDGGVPLLAHLLEAYDGENPPDARDNQNGHATAHRRGEEPMGLATTWLALAVCLETGLLRRRHFHEGAPWWHRLAWLWNATRESLFRAMSPGKQLHTPEPGPPPPGEPGPEPAGAGENRGDVSPHPTLRIDSLWLNAYLLHRITFEMDPHEVLETHFPERYLAMVFLRRFAQLTAYVHWNLARREDDDEEHRLRVLGRGVTPVSMQAYTDALIELVDVYAHHVLEVPFEVHVRRYLRHFLESQAALYVLKDHYRDHLYHVIDVFLLGDFLLRAQLGEERVLLGEVLKDRLARATARTVRQTRQRPQPRAPRPDLWKNWCVAALCHDLGYPLLIHREALRHSEGAPVGETLRVFVHGLREALQRIFQDRYTPAQGVTNCEISELPCRRRA